MPPAEGKITTYGELTKQLEQLRQTYAVYEYVYNYLDGEFVTKDGRPPRKVLAAEGSTSPIPESVVEDVLEALGNGAIQELRDKIENIERQSLVFQEEVGEDVTADGSVRTPEARPRTRKGARGGAPGPS